MSQANDILDFIKRNCKVEVFIKGLKDGKNLGITALEIQNEYGILRNNASSILNLLCKNGKLVKINSRPVTFIDKEILKDFHDEILNKYIELLDEDKNAILRMKELWGYMIYMFSDNKKYAEQIKKSQNLRDYNEVVLSLFLQLKMAAT